MVYVGSPSFVLFSQFAFTAVFILAMAELKVIESDKLEWAKVNEPLKETGVSL